MKRPVSAARSAGRGLFALLALPLLAGMALAVAGCGEPSAEEVAADQEEIRAFLQEYLPAMSEAYRTGDTEPLTPYTTLKERETIEKRVRDLARQGSVLSPELVSLEVEDVVTWSAVNAFVTTVEVWDLRVLASGSDSVIRETEGQANRVKYQLKRQDDRWRVFGRQLQETFE
jgi:hypothetical protein